MPPFKKLRIKQYPLLDERETAEAKYWKSFTKSWEEQHPTPAACIHFSPANPKIFAVTSSIRVSIYDALSSKAHKTFSRFKDVAYSGQFRSDGKLLLAADAQGYVKVFDVASKAVLRQFKFHTAAVESTRWCSDNVHIISGSDDKTVGFWDLPSTDIVHAYKEHTDYVKRMFASPVSPHLFCSGSYDHSVKLWDSRQATSVTTIPLTAPVEDVLLMPSGSLLLAAAANTVYVYDILSGGRLLHHFTAHAKNVTAITLDGSGSRILTAGLGGHVKIHDVTTFTTVYGFKFKAPVVSVAVSPDNTKLVTGLVDGTLSVRTRKKVSGGEDDDEDGRLKVEAEPPSTDEIRVERVRSTRLKQYEKSLRKFKYAETLDHALSTRNIVVVLSVLEELISRQGLDIALSGRDETTLEPLLSFISRYLSNPRYTSTLIDVANRVCNLYGSVVGQSDAIDELFHKIHSHASAELELHRNMMQVLGALDCVTAASCGRKLKRSSTDISPNS